MAGAHQQQDHQRLMPSPAQSRHRKAIMGHAAGMAAGRVLNHYLGDPTSPESSAAFITAGGALGMGLTHWAAGTSARDNLLITGNMLSGEQVGTLFLGNPTAGSFTGAVAAMATQHALDPDPTCVIL